MISLKWKRRGRPSNKAREAKKIAELLLCRYENEISAQAALDTLVYGQSFTHITWDGEKGDIAIKRVYPYDEV